MFLLGDIRSFLGGKPCKLFVWICGGVAKFGDRKPHFCHINYCTRKRYTRFVHVLLTKSKLLCSRETAVNRNFLDMMPFTVLGIVVFLVWVGVNDLHLLIIQMDCCLCRFLSSRKRKYIQLLSRLHVSLTSAEYVNRNISDYVTRRSVAVVPCTCRRLGMNMNHELF